MALNPSHSLTLVVPDAESEAEFLLFVNQLAVKAYRQAHPIPHPPFMPSPADGDTLTSAA